MIKPSKKFRSEFYRNLAFVVGIVPGTIFMQYFVLNDPALNIGFIIRIGLAIVFIFLFRELIKHSFGILEEAENE